MNVKKRFRDFLVELKAEKAKALDDLKKEFTFLKFSLPMHTQIIWAAFRMF